MSSLLVSVQMLKKSCNVNVTCIVKGFEWWWRAFSNVPFISHSHAEEFRTIKTTPHAHVTFATSAILLFSNRTATSSWGTTPQQNLVRGNSWRKLRLRDRGGSSPRMSNRLVDQCLSSSAGSLTSCRAWKSNVVLTQSLIVHTKQTHYQLLIHNNYY